MHQLVCHLLYYPHRELIVCSPVGELPRFGVQEPRGRLVVPVEV
jgi:hypothetical protein